MTSVASSGWSGVHASPAQWRIVSPESSLMNVGADGYIAQVWTGTARTSRRPSRCERRKSVWLESPTANCPAASTAADAPRLHAVSTAMLREICRPPLHLQQLSDCFVFTRP